MRRGIVVAPQPEAVAAGLDILKRGGNALDAALATALAQGVVDPLMAGVGGFGALVVFDPVAGTATVVDFPGRAGSKATAGMFAPFVLGRVRGHAERYHVEGFINQIGYQSVCVPGVPLGFWEAHRHWGSLPWREIFGPAIALARDGFRVSGDLFRQWTRPQAAGHVESEQRFAATRASSEMFLDGGRLREPGSLLAQPDLARTLAILAGEGPRPFYEGGLAERIVRDFEEHGGLLTQEDFRAYRVATAPALTGTYRGETIYTCPPPSSGCQVIEILNILEGFPLGDLRAGDLAEYVRVAALAQRASFVDRATSLADPAFADVPLETFLDKGRGRYWRERIERGAPIEIPGLSFVDSPGTTHVSALDDSGLAVALTHTLGSGSGVVTAGLGFTYNNCMYQFHPLPGHPNSVAPGKARISGIAPTITVRSRAPHIVVGGAGGTRIITAVVHAITNVVDHGMTACEAVAAPRFHSESELVELESRLFYEVAATLEACGERPHNTLWAYDPAFARIDVIVADRERGRFTGSADPRSGGTAMSTWTRREA